MDQHHWLSEQFEDNRSQLRAVAYRMLGSLSEADNAVQESWLRVNQSATTRIGNISRWLTMVVARVSLDMLRSRKAHLRERARARGSDPNPGDETRAGCEEEVLLAHSVGLALLIVLETLEPAERLAFVLHDLFAVPFDEVAGILERSPDSARALTTRARQRVHGVTGLHGGADLSQQRELVANFQAASQHRDVEALLAVLDPDVIIQSDNGVTPSVAKEIRGAAAVSQSAARAGARASDIALVNGEAALIVAPLGRLMTLFRFTIARKKIIRIEAVTDPAHLHEFDTSVLND